MATHLLPDTLMPAPHVMTQQVDGETVLLNLQDNQFYRLNESAGRAWELLSESKSMSAALAQLRREYEVEPATLTAEIQDLFERLYAAQLVIGTEEIEKSSSQC